MLLAALAKAADDGKQVKTARPYQDERQEEWIAHNPTLANALSMYFT